MKKIYILFLFVSFVLSFTSCAKVEDPRKGGLFGYDPKGYEKRIKDREANLAELKGEENHYTLDQKGLETHILNEQTKIKEYQQRLILFNKQLNSLENDISSHNIQAKSVLLKKRKIESLVQELHHDAWKIKQKLNVGLTTKKEEIVQLQIRLKNLIEEAELLGDL